MIRMIKRDLQTMIFLLMFILSGCILVDASITTKNQYFKKIEVSASSLDKHSSTLATYNHLRTNVECGGQCLSYSGCEGFHFANNVCKLLKTELLYKDPTTQIDVYVAMSAGKEDASWTTWTAWDACRDDRLTPYGISATDTNYLCNAYDGSSNGYIYTRRYRTCQNHVDNDLKLARFGGYSHCVGTSISGNEQDDMEEQRPCPNLPACPRVNYYYFDTGVETMDNCETCCNGNVHGWGGHCDNDMRIRFEDKLGRSCTSNWLVNNHRVKHGRNGLNVAGDAFDFDGWVGFNWNEAGCASGAAFDVPNQDFQRVYIEHRGADGVDIDSVHVYIYQPTTNTNQCIQCRRKDNNAIFVGLMDNSDYVDLVCQHNC